MHPALKPLEFLIGTWQSTSAKGHFPTVKDFTYDDTITFEEIGQPLLNFKSVSKIGERPMHVEQGFLRINPGTNQVAFLVSHNFGITEISEGTVEDKKVRLESKEVARISFAKAPHVTKLRRTFTVADDGTLEVVTDMATTTVPDITNHLIVSYKKV